MDPSLLEVCACPKCGGELRDGDPITCPACPLTFPTVQGIPVLSANASAWLADWRRQVAVYQKLIASGASAMEQQRQAPDLLPATRARLEKVQDAAAENGARVIELLHAAGIIADPAGKDLSESGFHLIEYYDHLLRDWAWDDDSDENARARDLALEAIGPDRQLGRVLVLGAGGCRLAYDLHLRCKPTMTVALDLSPLFLVAAKRVLFGNGLRLWEFPAIPRDASSVCLERELRAPAGSPSRFHLLLADAFTPPLRPGSFDTVLTPWFIDIVPVDVRETLSLIHRLLVPGGRWVNYGPLNYAKESPPAQRYTPEELGELVRRAGFERGDVKQAEIQLLGSRASANGRTERVLAFSARQAAAPASDGDPPAWLLFSHLPIPRFPRLDAYRPEHPVLAYVARAIDGKATVRDLADAMIREHGARPDAALPGTRALVAIVYQACR